MGCSAAVTGNPRHGKSIGDTRTAILLRRRQCRNFGRVMIGSVLAALCCFSQPAPESKAETGSCPGESSRGPIRLVKCPLEREASGWRNPARGGRRRGSENWKRMGETVVSGGDEPTKVKIRGEHGLGARALAYGGYDVNVHLVLDTGASKTTINTEVAEQLTLDLSRAKRRGCRLPGAVLEARMVKMNSVTVGPQTNATGIYRRFP